MAVNATRYLQQSITSTTPVTLITNSIIITGILVTCDGLNGTDVVFSDTNGTILFYTSAPPLSSKYHEKNAIVADFGLTAQLSAIAGIQNAVVTVFYRDSY